MGRCLDNCNGPEKGNLYLHSFSLYLLSIYCAVACSYLLYSLLYAALCLGLYSLLTILSNVS